MNDNHMPLHERFRVAGLLALVGGFLDAYTYILRGGVFANAQTGNMVMLAIRLAEWKWKEAGYYVIPILAFSAGVFMTNLLKKNFSENESLNFERMILLFEMILLLLIGFLPLTVPNGVVNVSVSFLCSVQVNTFRKVRDIPYASTMCTGNLRSGTEKLFLYIMEKDKRALKNAVHYFGIIFLFMAGAVLGTIFTEFLHTRSIWFCCLLLFVAAWETTE